MTVAGLLWELPMSERRIKETESGLWRTPTAHEWKNIGHSTQIHLSDQVRPEQVKNPKKLAAMWPTPTVCGNYNRKGASATSGDGLATAVKMFPTPQASDNRNRGNADTPAIARRIAAGKQVTLTMTVSGGQLNPMWVEWLMGWPLGWTDLRPLETDRFQQWQQQHGGS